MTLFALSLFGVSLFGILLLFAVKRYEVTHPLVARGAWRESADLFALRVKWVLMVIEWYLAHTPLFLAALARWGVHAAALGFARLARTSEEQAHRVADLVSHKRNFERRETKSAFLKEVSERPMRNRSDTEDEDGPVATL